MHKGTFSFTHEELKQTADVFRDNAAFEENPEILKMASFAQSLHSGGNPLQDLLSSLSSED